jgi:NAD-dependent SIR2 family protein deacetylase
VDLAKVHGSADRARCSGAHCPLGVTRTIELTDLDFRAFEREPRRETIPRCPECRAVMRPHVLLFDELYTGHPDYRWSSVMEACDSMHLVLAVGTSFSVGVTDFVQVEANRRGVPMFVVDPGAPSGVTASAAVHVREKAEELLPMVVEALVDRSRPTGEVL